MNRNATVKIDLNSQHKGEEKPVCLRVTFARQPRQVALGLPHRLTKEEFANKSLKKTKEALKAVTPDLTKAQQIIDELGVDFTFPEFVKRFKGEIYGDNRGKVMKLDLKTVFEEYVVGKEFSTANRYMRSCRAILGFKKKTSIADIDKNFMVAYEKYRKDKSTDKDKALTTVGIDARHLRAVYNYCVKKGYIEDKRPFDAAVNYKIPEGRNIQLALPVETLTLLVNYQTEDPNKRFALDMFLFSFYENGMNWEDLLHLTSANIIGDTIVWVRKKTEETNNQKKQLNTVLLPECRDILMKYGNIDFNNPSAYILPVIVPDKDDKFNLGRKQRFTKKVNKGLKAIADELEIPQFKGYAARHSFATFAVSNGLALEEIRQMLGHSNVAVTERYIASLGLAASRKLVGEFAKLKNDVLEGERKASKGF